MIPLRIRHRTTYAYRRRGSLGPHRLMLRPRESRDLRLVSSKIKVTPAGALTWAHDVFGNTVTTVTFSMMSDVLAIDATTELELHASAWPVFDIAASAIAYPFRYSDDEWTDLSATTVQQYAGPGRASEAMGARFCRRQWDRYALSAQGPQRRRFPLDRLSEPR